MRRNPILRHWKLRGSLMGGMFLYMFINMVFGSEIKTPIGDNFSSEEYEKGYILYEKGICDRYI